MEQKDTWLIKICCVIAAFSLWLYIVTIGNNEVTRRVTVAVELTNIDSVTDKKLVILPEQQFTVALNVKGTPADIELGKEQFKVVADMSMYALSKGEIRIPVTVERQPVNVTVLDSGYYVKVMFDDLVQKSVPVKVSISGKAKEGFYAFPQTINPTEVIVSGAAKFVNAVTAVEAGKDINNYEEDINFNLPLKAVDADGKEVKNVSIDTNTVQVTIPVKRTKTVGINVKTKGNISNEFYLKSLVPQPEKVDIAGGNAINNITALDTEPVDLSTLSPNKNIVVKLIVPEGISLINSDGTVKVKANLEKVISKTYSLNIGIKNLNEVFTAALDIQKVSITVSGAESTINTIKEEDFSAFADLSGITSEGEYSLKINTIIPQGVTKISTNPQSVKVTLKKKEASAAGNSDAAASTNAPTNGGQ
ncbi:CdaR family protein [Clostridium sp. SYSU_GA19001]|uniref:CdaR family protein n=1 Tax=Clostridium caldaquaticum TaxID=2940653 RepID=UPI0020771095|nr:CdaR family protein [Clostridium caldaquaticum]MCM8710726.1 CdaR family protein [Clostridium caldaquaticum]